MNRSLLSPRSALLACVLLVLVAGGLWFGSRRGSQGATQCQVEDGCEALFTPAVALLDLDEPSLARHGMVVGFDDVMVLALEDGRSEDDLPRRTVVAAFDPTDGSLQRTLIDRSGRSVVVEGLGLSDDSSFLAMTTVAVTDSGEVLRMMEIIDVETGVRVAATDLEPGETSCRPTFSADASLVECSGSVFDVRTGDPIGPSDDFDGFEFESGWIRLAFRSAFDLVADPANDGSSIDVRMGEERWSFLTAPTTIEPNGPGTLTLRPDGAVVVHHRVGSHDVEVTAYDLATGEIVQQIRRPTEVAEAGWAGPTTLATITADLQVLVYEIG